MPNLVQDDFEEQITMDEQEYVVKSSPNNKSPGLDGLCYEFFKITWEIIQTDLLEVMCCQLSRKKILASNKKGVTRLCPKSEQCPFCRDVTSYYSIKL